ncbi:hypothetical protein FHS39_000408 [Streptomyces olivoverticillatus]|uniref:Uncharacterized protein n=1 Tax=Streptomyces olivoverticillatus TaxID=66427 RepID=A0A7W7PJH0_9ACTN|nr:hypothetical protein [Streptomyces olivoverticillatus]MBB4891408.1 hypothetical protein [Streptomyces olivoverticillatus]
MAALAWLLIPVAAAVVAALWGSWAARNRKAGDVAELAGYAKFREAMERSESGSGPAA